MTAAAALAAGRRAARALMVAQCEVTRLLEVSLDTGTLTLRDDDPSNDRVYAGPCRIKAATASVFVVSAEGQTLDRQDLVLHLPADDADALAVQIGDRVRIVDGGPNPSDTGRTFRVAGIAAATIATALRFPVEHAA